MQDCWQKLPEQFLDRINYIIPETLREQVLSSFCQRHPSTFRANTLKISVDDLQKALDKLQIQTKRVSWYQDAFILANVSQKVLTQTDLYQQGFFYVQSLSSMIPPLVLDPKPDEKILDITAAPGSKTTQIATLMQNAGEIIANDKSRIRLYKLDANLKIQGVLNTKTLNLPAEAIWKKFPEYFDKTLVDVPCSMEGRFYTEDEKTFHDWRPGKVKQLSEMQKWILRSGISATRPGGTIVYSTCTLSPEENEGVIDWILKKEKGKIELENIEIKNLQTYPGLIRYTNKLYDKSLKKTFRIYPSELMEGFFVARIKKINSTITGNPL